MDGEIDDGCNGGDTSEFCEVVTASATDVLAADCYVLTANC